MTDSARPPEVKAVTPADVDDGRVSKPTTRHVPTGFERGASIGRYLILEELGSGGMGVVFKAHDPELDRMVALKLLRTSDGEERERLRDRLRREAQGLARLSHPNVVALHDVGSVGVHVFLAMEFVDGQTLNAWLKKERRSSRAILDVFSAAGEGLAAAHRAGLVHRDFKPDNVMVGEDGRARVLDFGLVRAASPHGEGVPTTAETRLETRSEAGLRAPETSTPHLTAPRASMGASPVAIASCSPHMDSPDSSFSTGSPSAKLLQTNLTVTGSIMGTPRYMAPEQHLGEKVDERTDQFSFCLCLYEALYRADPFSDATSAGRISRLVEGNVRPARADARVPARLRAILIRGLSPAGASRWPSMDVLLAELRKDPAAAWRRGAALTISVLALASLLIVSGFAIHARRVATKQAELAREFGQEEAQIASTARIAALLPLHDLRPEMADIRARMAMIEQHMTELGSVATGPGHDALGRGFVALEQWQDAVRELEAAWSAGYHNPDLAYLLGVAHGKLYQRALTELVKTDDEAANLAARDAIARAHREPALRYLAEAKPEKQEGGTTRGVAPPALAKGQIALYEGHFDDALGFAREAFTQSPALFEAHTLEGDVEVAIANESHWKGDRDGERGALERSGKAYQAALETARSSAAALNGECQRLVHLAWRDADDRRSPDANVGAALTACGAAAKAQPADAKLVALEARAWDALLFDSSFHGREVTADFEGVKKLVEASLQIDPAEVMALQVMGNAYLDVSDSRRLHGQDSRPATEESIVYARKALALDPTNFGLYGTLGYALESKGKEEIKQGLDPHASFAAQVDCAMQQRRYFPHSEVGLHMLESAHLVLGQWQRDHGVSPEAELSEGLKTCAEETAVFPRSGGAHVSACYGEWIFGTWLSRIGEDPRTHLARAVSACNDGLALQPGEWTAHLDLGVTASALASWQVARGDDASAAIEDARRDLKRAVEIDPNHLTYRYVAELEVIAARAAMAHGVDPASAFRDAEAAVRRVLSTNKDDSDALRALASLERRRAEWLVQRKQPADASLRDGLAAASRAEELTPDVAESFAIEGALHVVAARAAQRDPARAHEADLARTALSKALAINGFLSHEFQPLLDEAVSLSGH